MTTSMMTSALTSYTLSHRPVLCEVCTVPRLQALRVLDQPLNDEVEDNEKNDELG